MNPYTPGFAAPGRLAWCRATRRWLKRHLKIDAGTLATEWEVVPGTIYQLNQHGRAPEWFCELLGAYVTGWRPSRDWRAASMAERLETFHLALGKTGWDDATADYFFALAPERWFRAILGRTAHNVPVRLAVLAEAILDGAVPCGLPFHTWGE